MRPLRQISCALLRAVLALAFLLLVWTVGVGRDQPAKTAKKPADAAEQAIPPATQNTQLGPERADAGSDLGSDSSARLGAGDLLDITIYNVPELATKTRIGDSGDIYLPLIDHVHVTGLTLEEAQTLIEKRLSDGGFVKSPHVTVFLAESASEAVTVLGQVARPGPYSVIGDRHLYDVISAAGGLTERAGKTVTITHRGKPDQPVKVILAEGLAQTSESNVRIQPGDTVVVQRAGIVYVMGAVARPAAFLMDSDHLTVLQVIALAGGTDKTAKLNGTKIIRQTPQGVIETPIELKRILQAKVADVPLRADDILFVPGSAGKVAAYRTADVLVQAGTLSLVALRP